MLLHATFALAFLNRFIFIIFIKTISSPILLINIKNINHSLNMNLEFNFPKQIND